MFPRARGARPDELRRLAAVLGRAADEVAWLRRRIDVAQARSPAGRADTRSLLRLQAWLDDNAVDVRRRAARLEEAGGRRSWLGDFHPMGVGGGRCGSVLVPVTARRADGRGGDEGLGEPLFAAAPLQCAPGGRRRDEGPLAFVATPTGLVVYARGGKRGKQGGGGGDGGSAGGKRPLTLEELLSEKRLPHGEGVEFAFEPDPRWRPGQKLKWDSEQRGYVDAKGDVWRRGRSRTPGDPFEWDVQLHKDSRWKKYSKDRRHLNIDLRGRISH